MLPEEVVGEYDRYSRFYKFADCAQKVFTPDAGKYSPFLRPPPVDAAPERHGGAKRRRARREGMDSPQAKEAGAGASDAEACEASLATLCFTVESDWETTRT